METKEIKSKKQSHPLEGMSIAAVMLWLGLLLLYSPYYLNINSSWRWLFNGLGGLAIMISFVGALLELAKLWKNQASEYFGISLVFLMPAGFVHFAIQRIAPTPVWEIIGRSFVLVLAAFGGMFLIMAVPYIFLKPAELNSPTKVTEQEAAEQRAEKRKTDINTIMSLIIALLSLAAGLIKLIIEFGK
ncbi:MAG: hypothetical protein ACYC4D_06985 [Thermoleophilia bacterium]